MKEAMSLAQKQNKDFFKEVFIRAKEAISPWIKNNASASLLNITGDLSGLYLEDILRTALVAKKSKKIKILFHFIP